MPRKFTLSPTKLRTFATCPAKYRWEYVERLGRFYRRPRAGFSFGASLHNVLEEFHAKGGAESVPVERLSEALAEKWQSQGYQSAAQEAAYRLEAERILSVYHAAAEKILMEALPDAPPPPTILLTEKTLSQDLTPEIRLSGRVDRVDEHHDGGLEIVDYKSGRESVTEIDVKSALAMNVYQALVKHAYPERRVWATIVALKTGDSASYELTDDERTVLLADCQETGEILLRKDWEHVLPVLNEHCPYCDYLPHCQRIWRTHREFEDG